jgi:iron-sulfur cluster assembly accessory protein
MNQQSELTLELTPTAEKFIRRMLRFSVEPNSGFRLKVRAGGCSGFAVQFDLASEPADKEIVWDYAGLRIFLDAESRLLLDGSVLDFKDSRAQSDFVVIKSGEAAQACSPASNMVSVASLVQR